MQLNVPICPECHHRGSMRAGDPAYCYCKCHDAADLAPVLVGACTLALAHLDALVPCHPTPALLELHQQVRAAVEAVANQPRY